MSDMTNIHKEIAIPNRIFLKGLDVSTKEDEIRNIFIKYGSIIEVKIIRDQFRGESKGYGFVTFDSQLVAESVLSKCKLVEINDREVMVGPAKIRRKPPTTKNPREYPPLMPNSNRNGPPVPYTVSPDGLFMFYQQNPYLVQQTTSPHVFANQNSNTPPPPYVPPTNTPPPRYPNNSMIHQQQTIPSSKGIDNSWSPVVQHDFLPTYHQEGHFSNMRISNENNLSTTHVEQKYEMLHNNNEMYQRPPYYEIDECHRGVHYKKPHSPSHHHLASNNSHYPNATHYLPTTTSHQMVNHENINSNDQLQLNQENQNIAITLLNGNMPNQVICVPVTTIMSTHSSHQGPIDVMKNEINRVSKVTEIKESRSTSPKIVNSGRSNQSQCQQHKLLETSSSNVALKDQKFVFMSTGLGKVKRVVVQG